jgi:hypothetical protein
VWRDAAIGHSGGSRSAEIVNAPGYFRAAIKFYPLI